jgi:hypothetical protein
MTFFLGGKLAHFTAVLRPVRIRLAGQLKPNLGRQGRQGRQEKQNDRQYKNNNVQL